MNYRVIVAGVIEKDGSYLFGRKATDVGPYPNKWLIIGGGIDLGEESAEEALKREVREEAGIAIHNIEQVSFFEDNQPKNGVMTHHIFLQYKADYLSGVEKPGDDIETLKWVSKDELKDLDMADVTRVLLRKLHLL